RSGKHALLPDEYYTMMVPALLRKEAGTMSASTRSELALLGHVYRTSEKFGSFVTGLFDRMIPQSQNEALKHKSLDDLLEELGFDQEQHDRIRKDLKSGRIGLAKNRLPVNTIIEDVDKAEISLQEDLNTEELIDIGSESIKRGELAIVTLAGGVGSRWTKGAGVVKSLNPFVRFEGKHRNFLEVHLAKTRKTENQFSVPLQHVFTTSYLTHSAIADFINESPGNGSRSRVYVSPGKVIGLRLVPTERDLRFMWEEMPQQQLDEQAQKLRESLRGALIGWSKSAGEAEDYRDNLPSQCIHPVGHWYEIPNLFLNGTLKQVIDDNPSVKYLLVHNIDTLGASADPSILGFHIKKGKTMSAEVITRRLEDHGGGLGKINGRLRLIEGMALPNERQEFSLSYYNTNTFWISIDRLLSIFGLTRAGLADQVKVKQAVYRIASLMPSYITIKDVKKRWGKGQEDVFPVTQFEKLWGDMTILPDITCSYIRVARNRGQQLKEVAQLDGWLRDGSKDYIEDLCCWE
ncbi:MAG TPA: UTP--glucose-1-phosphate uridylyltransferase, partial [Bacteroidales bacterium]|nr:UTP--glucose-1-phosphate uridylyltransferase [Bacteroidales bacterium]